MFQKRITSCGLTVFDHWGLFTSLAILATNLLTDIPAEAVSPTSEKIRCSTSCANTLASKIYTVTSKYASSRDKGSIISV
jgi:hypothetical protein